MAEPLGRAASIQLLEDAVSLLRQAPLSTLLCHWAGSLPLALGAIVFFGDMTRPRTTASAAALESLLLTMLWVWMNSWRAVFAGRLRGHLSGAADPTWTFTRALHLMALQACLGATKLVVLPIAGLVLFPFADAVAFYRNAAVFSDRQDLQPLQIVARARHLATLDRRQSWGAMSLLLPLAILLGLNVAVTIGALPQVFRILTGYETAFSRSGWFFLTNQTFVWLVFAVTWLGIDPLIQAAYTVRCFQAESLQTGEDLRAGLRRIRAAAVAIAMIVFAGCAFGAVTPQELEKSVRRVEQAQEYDWRLPPPPETQTQTPWIITVTDRIVNSLRAVFQAIGRALGRLLDWLTDRFTSSPARPGAPPGTGLHWSIYVLLALILAAGAGIAWRLRHTAPPQAVAVTAAAVRLDAEDLTADRLPEEGWLDLADRCLAASDYRLALRALYLANLAWLNAAGFLAIHHGKTNREYEAELRRRARDFPDARERFAANLLAFERCWYGLHEVSPDDASGFRRRNSEIKSILATSRGAAA